MVLAIWLAVPVGNSTLACLDKDLDVSKSSFEVIWFGWSCNKYGILVLSSVHFGLISRMGIWFLFILMVLFAWDLWVHDIPGLGSGIVLSVGLGSQNLGHCNLLCNRKFEQNSHRIMANEIVDGQQSMDSQKDFMDFQRLIISMKALHSKVSFILDTLIIHQEMVAQLQDELATIRRQVEEVQSHSAHRNLVQVSSDTATVNESQSDREAYVIPNLNLQATPMNQEDFEEMEVSK